MFKAISVKGLIMLVVLTLVFSITVFQQYDLVKTKGTLAEMTTELDYFKDENARLTSRAESKELAWRSEIRAMTNQLNELSALREQEERLLKELERLKKEDEHVENFLSTPIPSSLNGLR